MHCHQSCSKKKHGLLSTLILAAWDITALCQPCWPGLHSGLHLAQQFVLGNCRSCSLMQLHRNEVLTVTYCAFNTLRSVVLCCLRFACRTRLSSLRLLHSSVFASPVTLDCLRCWMAVTIIVNHSSPWCSRHNSALQNSQFKYQLYLLVYSFS
jgi:hypothetical protein